MACLIKRIVFAYSRLQHSLSAVLSWR